MSDGLDKEIRVRIAPSPTGPLHFGTARTALFNWFFARNHGGSFILRVEDTDVERSMPAFEADIITGLKWLGLDWDEGPDIGGKYGPYRQSERLDIYEKYLKKLIDDNNAFYCFCSKEELEQDRQAMLSQGLVPKYSGKCRDILKDETLKKIAKGDSAVIRFKMPAAEIEFHDLIRGKIKFDTSIIGDIVIARSLKSPLFIFAGVVDDYEMKISHVIRGEDHISNTPKQIMLQKALGFNEVEYAHLPLILSPDRSKLSKRYLESSLNDFIKMGYLPEAMVNFMAYLGWHPVEDKEIMSQEELIKEFNIKRVQKAGAIFNLEKLEWLNAQYIKKYDSKKLIKMLFDFIPENWTAKNGLLLKILETEKERLKTLSEFKELAGFFFELSDYDKKLLIWKNTPEDRIKDNLNLLINELKKVSPADFNKNGLESVLMPLTEVWGRGELLWPLRAALSGKIASPGPFEIMEILGKDETLHRIEIAVKKI